ncbi:MAG: alpha-L-fucosidase [Clostridiales bacterium]|jgi:alpha-L-fucosidase|nr:alpha-L-fucosidase [Clostridiales bacterium]
MYDWNAYRERIQWFEHDRFGMFIHWGLYAIPAKGEWLRSAERVSNEDYQKYFDMFDPVDYHPREWARIAKDAGMKYAVLTAKHHDGFCLFDSAYTGYKATNTKAGRDLVREYLEAFRAEGLKVGLYYSLLDWHHEDYPHYGDPYHPMRENEAYKGRQHNFDGYLEYMHRQVRELCTNYGKLDLLWFDFSYDDMTGERWRATDLVRMARSLQPHVLIDNRLEVAHQSSRLGDEPKEYAGDFVSPEQLLPPEGMRNRKGEPVLWEACVTMNNNWGYHQNDRLFKPPSMIIRKLAECVSKGGNLLLNVGPDARGRIPGESVRILGEVGKWIKKNGESVYGCGAADIAKPDFGRVTLRKRPGGGKTYYFHITENTVGLLPLPGIPKEAIKSVRLLETGAELPCVNDFRTAHYDNVFVHVSDDPVLPDETDTVVAVEL